MENIYHIPFAVNGWINPALILTGIFFLILTIFIKKRFLVIPACLLILYGAILEHDITVIAGSLACAAGLWIYFKP